MTSNVRHGHRVNARREWAAYDSLPAPLRQLVRQQAFNYDCLVLADDYDKARARGMSLSSIMARWKASFAAHRAKLCLCSYGPRHPEARP